MGQEVTGLRNSGKLRIGWRYGSDFSSSFWCSSGSSQPADISNGQLKPNSPVWPKRRRRRWTNSRPRPAEKVRSGRFRRPLGALKTALAGKDRKAIGEAAKVLVGAAKNAKGPAAEEKGRGNRQNSQSNASACPKGLCRIQFPQSPDHPRRHRHLALIGLVFWTVAGKFIPVPGGVSSSPGYPCSLRETSPSTNTPGVRAVVPVNGPVRQQRLGGSGLAQAGGADRILHQDRLGDPGRGDPLRRDPPGRCTASSRPSWSFPWSGTSATGCAENGHRRGLRGASIHAPCPFAACPRPSPPPGPSRAIPRSLST